MKLTRDWTEIHFLREDLRHKSKTRRQVRAWLLDMKLKECQDWVYGGYRSVNGQGKRHIFRLRDPSHAMLVKLAFA